MTQLTCKAQVAVAGVVERLVRARLCAGKHALAGPAEDCRVVGAQVVEKALVQQVGL